MLRVLRQLPEGHTLRGASVQHQVDSAERKSEHCRTQIYVPLRSSTKTQFSPRLVRLALDTGQSEKGLQESVYLIHTRLLLNT